MTVERETCVTCGDIAVVGIVREVRGNTAVVEVDGCREAVGVELVAPVAAGEGLLCHAGIALARVAAGAEPSEAERGAKPSKVDRDPGPAAARDPGPAAAGGAGA